jgi:D-sedoheptulose 7-phosphate isomerase
MQVSQGCMNGGGKTVRCSADYYEQLLHVFQRVPLAKIDDVAEQLFRCYRAEKTAYLFGNGGSASTASHFACDLTKGTSSVAGPCRFRAHALTDNLPTLTAWANDVGYSSIFVEQLQTFAVENDTLLAFSGSGNSQNVLEALAYGRSRRTFNIGIGGFDGGKMKDLCDLFVLVPSDNMQMVEDVHLTISHCLYTILRTKMADQKELLTRNAKTGVGA